MQDCTLSIQMLVVLGGACKFIVFVLSTGIMRDQFSVITSLILCSCLLLKTLS